MKENFKDVDDYINLFPKSTQVILEKIRAIIKENAPRAIELISYNIPGYKLNKKPLVYFAAYKKHIGLYATPSGHKEFEEKLSGYKQGKGSVQFPLDKEIPYKLIEDIMKFRVKEITEN